VRLESVSLSHPDFVAMLQALQQQYPDERRTLPEGDDLLMALVAYEQDRPIGCALLRTAGSDCAEIEHLYSAKQGTGQMLIQQLESAARDRQLGRVAVATRIRYSKAVNYFLHQGFKKCATLPRYKYSSSTICLDKQLS
jgi:N-acetylglutamate synthase-like GNAT family acetyltransferase